MAVTGNLDQIRSKVRNITGMLSTNQISVADLDNYINDFYKYDLPAHLKLWNLSSLTDLNGGPQLTLEPNVAEYNFSQNEYTNIKPPIYVGGCEVQLYQSVEEFFNTYPQRSIKSRLTTGTNSAGPYSGTISNIPIRINTVFISVVDNSGNSLSCRDDGAGNLVGADVVAGGTINYITGAVANLTWNGVIAAGEQIWAQSITYQTGRPEAMLFYDNILFFYPVPDIAYEVKFDSIRTPADLVNTTDEPEVRDWWTLIAYGASLKIFADNLDMESYSKIDILFDKQKRLVERRTLTQLKNQRVATIYTQGVTHATPFSSTL